MSHYDMDFQLADDGLESLHDSVQYDDSETQDVGRLFVPQPTGPTENRSSEASRGNKKRGRGKTIGKWAVGGVRERVKWGMYGAPVWPRDKCAHYNHFLGSLATNGVYFPIDVQDWRHFDVDNDLGTAWLHIEGTIDWSEADTAAKKSKIKKYALERLSDRWKHHKADLKKLFWVPNKGTDERFQCPLSSIDSGQWKAFVAHLDDDDTQTKADINVSNRSQRVMHHSTGTRTFSAVVYEWQVQNGVEEQPDRLEIFKLTHRKKGKTNEYVDAASTKAVQDLEKAEEERRKLNVEITPEVREDIYAEVFGPEKRNRVRGLGSGVHWRDVPNIHIEKRTTSSTVEAMKAKLNEQRVEMERLKIEAETERKKAAEREERIRNETFDMEKRLTAQMEDFKRQQEILMGNRVKQLATYEMGRMLRDAGFSQIETAPQMEPTQPEGSRNVIPTPDINDVYRPEIPQTVRHLQPC